jgi:hypothetical protein
VNQLVGRERVVWAFWAAGAIAFVGGLLPLAIGGTSSRMAPAAIPFVIGAAALVVCGFVYQQGRAVSAILYFVAGLALVYGMLAMFAVPLQLAVLGTCSAPPAPCTGAFGRPLTVAENTGMGFATGFAVAALFVGFFGLMVVFRRPGIVWPTTPPVRTIPPVETAEKVEKVEKVEEEAPTPVAVVAEPELELPAPEELPELPPHESNPPSN